MRPIHWLHISDIHMRPRDAWSQDVVLRAMCEHIERQRTELEIDFILVSGDLAYSGKSEEYVLVRQFFDDLATASGVPTGHIFCVPGNHDIDRDRQKLCFRGARVVLQNPSATDAFLASPVADDFVTLLKRQENYRNFQVSYFGDQPRILTDDGLGYATKLTIDGVRLAILGLDSAWLAEGGGDDHMKLLIGERQILNAIGLVENSGDPPHIVVAMAHHPTHLLCDFDRRSALVRIDRSCQFFHCGHLHEPEARPTGNNPRGCLTFAAGASFETRHTQNTYSVVTLDLLHALRTVKIVQYNPSNGAFASASTHDYRIEVMPTDECEVSELATTVAACAQTPWPHYVAALLLAKKSDLPVPISVGNHTFASFEVMEALPDCELKTKTAASLTFRNALRVLYGHEAIEDIFQQHGDAVIEYCAALSELSAEQPALRTRLDEFEQDAVLLATGEARSSFSHTRALLRDLAGDHEWASLREQARRHTDASDSVLATEAKRMLALALANSSETTDKDAAVVLYRSLVESSTSNPTDVGNLVTLLMEADSLDEAKAALLQGVATCPSDGSGGLDSLAEIGYRIVETTGDKDFRDHLKTAIVERGTR